MCIRDRDAILAFENDDVLFPEKIVQIFDDATQQRINCLPATFKKEKICGVKWVSVFPPNPVMHGVQNLSAVIILSEIEHGFPIAFMEGTLCSNMRVGAMGALAASRLARQDATTIGFIGAGEQAKMHLLAMKTAVPSLERCLVAAKDAAEEANFQREMQPLLPGMTIEATASNLEAAVSPADIVVTATSAQAPLLKAAWLKEGVFYSHIGGWEDEYLSLIHILGGPQATQRKTYQLASPLSHLDKDDPPCWFITGENDDPSTHAAKFRKQMSEFDIASGLTVIKKAPHPFLGKQVWFDEAMNTAGKFFSKTLK